MRCSIIIPVLNEAVIAGHALRTLAALRENGAEVIVVDGGSDDDTIALCEPWADKVLCCDKARAGRAQQMNLGASKARFELLLFLHLDASLPAGVAAQLTSFEASPLKWGFFKVRLSANGVAYRIIERAMNWRSAATSVATGDQALVVRRDCFARLGGFADIPLMEDVEISKRLRQQGKPQVLPGRITASARRWQQHGVLRTVLLMWSLRARYFFGANPQALAQRYYPA